MKRKTFVKKLMSTGVSRNAANWGARHGEPGVRFLANMISLPGVRCISHAPCARKGDIVVRGKTVWGTKCVLRVH